MNKRTRIVPTVVLLFLAAGAEAATMKLKASNGLYVTASNGAVSLSSSGTAFTVIDANGQCMFHEDTISLRSSDGKYLGADGSGSVTATATTAGANEKFRIQDFGLQVSDLAHGEYVTLISGSNQRLCVQNGALRATCSSPVNEAKFQIELSPIPKALAASVSIPSPSMVDKAIYLRPNVSNGPQGTTKYKYRVKNNATGGVVLDQAETTESQKLWTPTDPGSYRLEMTVLRYCHDHFVSQAMATVGQHQVGEVTFSAPTAVTAGAPATITWSGAYLSGPARLSFYNGATKVADITPVGETVDLAGGSYSWTAPQSVPQTSTGKVLIMSTTNSAMQFSSAPVSVTASPLAWKWTTRLTPAHFEALGVALNQEQIGKLNTTQYSISTIVNSQTDRLVDNMKCNTCHTGRTDQSAARYRPIMPIMASYDHYRLRGDETRAVGYRWSAGYKGVVSAFVDSPAINKPEALEKLFKAWLAAGAQ